MQKTEYVFRAPIYPTNMARHEAGRQNRHATMRNGKIRCRTQRLAKLGFAHALNQPFNANKMFKPVYAMQYRILNFADAPIRDANNLIALHKEDIQARHGTPPKQQPVRKRSHASHLQRAAAVSAYLHAVFPSCPTLYHICRPKHTPQAIPLTLLREVRLTLKRCSPNA